MLVLSRFAGSVSGQRTSHRELDIYMHVTPLSRLGLLAIGTPSRPSGRLWGLYQDVLGGAAAPGRASGEGSAERHEWWPDHASGVELGL